MSSGDVARLREETGAGMMDCKRALDAAKGDYAKALEILAQQGLAKADKKGDRAIGAGHLEAYIHGGRVGVLLDVGAETDFVTRSEPFREFAKNLAMHIAAAGPESVDELLKQNYVRDESMTIENYMKSVIAKVGENIRVNRFTRYQV
jgi:elongation factor Ts